MKIYIKWFFAIVISMSLGLLTSKAGQVSLESSLAGFTGAVVGGVIAALAFIFGLLLELVKKTDSQSRLFQPLSISLRSDVMILIWSLCLSIFLPIIRNTNFPCVIYPPELAKYLSKDQIITSFEVLVVIIAISVLFEICDSMFRILIAASTTK